MLRLLDRAALAVAFVGWVCAVLTRLLSLWKVSGTVDNTTATLPAYWDGVWLEWNHWDLGHDGKLHCSFYQSLISLSGSFRTWTALINAAVGVGVFAVVIGALGVVWFTWRWQIKVFSGSLFVLSAFLLLIPTAWTSHHTSLPLEGAELLRRDWGPALYLGWVSFSLMLVGGLTLIIIRCFIIENQGATATPSSPQNVSVQGPDEEASHPLNTIYRTAFTNSQYGRRPPPV